MYINYWKKMPLTQKTFLIRNLTSRVLKIGGFITEEGVRLTHKSRSLSVPGGALELTFEADC